MDIGLLSEKAREFWNRESLPALKAFITRGALSPAFDPKWEERGVLLRVCREASEFGLRAYPSGTFTVEKDPGLTPALAFSIPGTGGFEKTPGNTVFFYGHLDTQPHASGWSEGLGPTEPVVRDGKLYGRGAADDGFAFYAAVTAARALDAAGVARPRFVGLIETCEESGSGDIRHYLERNAALFGNPKLACLLDTSAGDYERLWLTCSLRGWAAADLRIRMLTKGIHSGTAGGMVPSTFDVLRILLDRIEDAETGEFHVPGLPSGIPESRKEDLRKQAETLGDAFLGNLPWYRHPDGSKARSRYGTALEALENRCWKPSLSITGVGGIPPLDSAANLVRPETAVRLSFRTPPETDASAFMPSLEKLLTGNPPFNAGVTLENTVSLPGWVAPEEAPWFRNAYDAGSRALWGKDAMRSGEGYSLPTIPLFASRFPRAQFAVTGAQGPDSNAHSADESLDLAYAEKFVAAVAVLASAVPEGE
ncbi:MAG: M20/M25/M40 family metallo-hydrolase [Sutterellaceae bacterium]|nr:M20/M25/M40 family metallo-hydrolase [Sutterellaceae bacterium]MDD7441670.1 M20/M25/M40 family metallo-hydrolase [Sutterellaceae bacterium]MDY2868268.1 M20/M25/M40 family metallo-hydrolase [Mesosutterella sp.]